MTRDCWWPGASRCLFPKILRRVISTRLALSHQHGPRSLPKTESPFVARSHGRRTPRLAPFNPQKATFRTWHAKAHAGTMTLSKASPQSSCTHPSLPCDPQAPTPPSRQTAGNGVKSHQRTFPRPPFQHGVFHEGRQAGQAPVTSAGRKPRPTTPGRNTKTNFHFSQTCSKAGAWGVGCGARRSNVEVILQGSR